MAVLEAIAMFDVEAKASAVMTADASRCIAG
jgi:hypothetical protein